MLKYKYTLNGNYKGACKTTQSLRDKFLVGNIFEEYWAMLMHQTVWFSQARLILSVRTLTLTSGVKQRKQRSLHNRP